MNSYVLGFKDIDKTKLMVVGGKGANLGELYRIDGIVVPDGFCVTTEAYRDIVSGNKELHSLLQRLSQLKVENRDKICEISGNIRSVIENATIPKGIEEEIRGQLAVLGSTNFYAVRSSATAEDLPNASFAGQQDTYLNIVGEASILKHISKCWASLFTDRAVIYRIQNGFPHDKVQLSVVVQRMVFPEASGIMFTADPITSNRRVLSIDAGFGLGEALVSGLVNADIYKVRDGRIIEKKISDKQLAIFALKAGGTEERKLEPEKRKAQVLTDSQILMLEKTGRKIEAYFGCPQDIEWCLNGNELCIVQSRPITTLYPAPQAADNKNHVYFSFGHRQMMTEAMKPLGLALFQDFFSLISGSPMKELGGRFYIDISRELGTPVLSSSFVKSMGIVDVLMQKALYNVLKRREFVKDLYHGKTAMIGASVWLNWGFAAIDCYRKNDHDIVKKLIAQNEAVMHDMESKIIGLSGPELFDFVPKSFKIMKDAIFTGYGAVFAGTYASSWLNKNLLKWLGEKNASDILAQSVPDNVTAEMGLELMDVADVVRQYPRVVEYFNNPNDDTFFEDLEKLSGGRAVKDSMCKYLKKYGMRCSGEIDITRTRWNEKPAILVPMILSNIKAYEHNGHGRKFQQGLAEASLKEKDILSRLAKMPGGKQKAKKVKRMISILRNYAGYREYNKYIMIWYFGILKEALMKEADKLVQKGVIREREDVYYLSLDEFDTAVRTQKADQKLIDGRKEQHKLNEKLTPPRVITSEGEIISGEYDRGSLPEGALAGVAVSSGVVEGRARVVMRLEDAAMEEGDILVTIFTDPSWTPVFVSIKGLVTEVGGMMTHGAVVAREYGLPAVVGLENATGLIRDGQRIRINGTEGYVELLD